MECRCQVTRARRSASPRDGPARPRLRPVADAEAAANTGDPRDSIARERPSLRYAPRMLDVAAPIEPGRGLGGLAIGAAVDAILGQHRPLRVIEIPGDDEDPDGVTIHSFGSIRTWSVKGRIVQIGAFEGYAGTTPEGIGIGSTIAELAATCGEARPSGADGFIVLPSRPGVGIETTEWSTGGKPDPDARIVQIYVHAID